MLKCKTYFAGTPSEVSNTDYFLLANGYRKAPLSKLTESTVQIVLRLQLLHLILITFLETFPNICITISKLYIVYILCCMFLENLIEYIYTVKIIDVSFCVQIFVFKTPEIKKCVFEGCPVSSVQEK